jgi:hypothetical protein
MIEAAERLRLQPCDPRWRAGFLDTSVTNLDADHIQRLIDRSHSLLVILDYAETRAERVRDLIERAWELREGKRIRIVLLARAPGDWWRELHGGGGQAGRLLRALSFPEVELKSLSNALPERRAIFDQALAAFQRAIPQKERAPAPASIPDLSKEHFSNVLLMHMAANTAARGKTLESEDALFDEMLAHESNYWREHVASDIPAAPYRGALALLTLSQGAAVRSGVKAVAQRALAALDYGLEKADALTDALQNLYPGEQGGASALRPDRIGEFFVMRCLAEQPSLLALAFSPDVNSDARQAALTVLTRLTKWRQEEGHAFLSDALSKDLHSLLPLAIRVAE